MAKHRVEKRHENPTTRESIVVEGTLDHPEENIETVRRLIVDGEITPTDVEWDAEVLDQMPVVKGSFNVIVYG